MLGDRAPIYRAPVCPRKEKKSVMIQACMGNNYRMLKYVM